ncbi:c-type cytochrome domain-containing protein [Chryseolinea sp. T2]|uniref:c-type cytochrome domain-containing protein n=1 Tax=Chryseolinea sp. T2 TaxID=3129255 RepID=UPI003076FFFE
MTQTRFAAIRKWISIAVALVGVGLLVLPFTSLSKVPLLFLFVGRLHPLVLHFPIVASLLALGIEVSRLTVLKRLPIIFTEILVAIATVSSWITIGAGYFLYASGDYSGETIAQHFWAGTLSGTGLSIALSLLLYYHITGRLYAAFLATLALTNAAVAYASHLGGTVTHGQEYLVEYLDMMRAQDNYVQRSESELLLYADMVSPVLESRCASCHNQQRAKGGLALDRYQQLFGAGDSNKPAIVPGSESRSEALIRIHLPLNDDEHMPPEGKSPLTADEIALLTYWIKSGASDTSRVWTARGVDTIRASLDRLAPELQKYQLRMAVSREKNASTYEQLISMAPALGLIISRDSLNDGQLHLGSTVPPHRLTDESLHKLAPYYSEFSGLSLPSSGLEDDDLYYLAQMVNVKAMYLQKNALEGSGLIYLSKMPALETLNLSYTRLDDRHALELLKFPVLKKVYLFRTNVSADVIRAIRRNRPGLELLQEEGPYR